MSRETSGFRATPARSLLTPGAVSDFVADRYGVVATNCVLLRSLNNDVYRIDGRGASWILKIYGHDWVTAVDLEWELDLLEHLLVQGIQFQPPCRHPMDPGSTRSRLRRDIASLSCFRPCPESRRLRRHLPQSVGPTGRAFAEMYNAADGFVSEVPGDP